MLIHSLKINNLLSFGPDFPGIDLDRLNVLVGPNASGKSNLIEVIALLRSCPKELAISGREGGGIGDWLWKGAAKAPVAAVDAVIDNPQGRKRLRYHLEFTESRKRIQITDERVENETAYEGYEEPYFYYRYEHNQPVLNVADQKRILRREDIDPEQCILSQRKDPDQYPEITYLGEVLSEIRLYREWSFGRYTPARVPQQANLPNRYLEEDGSNIGLVLNRLKKKPTVKRKLLEHLRLLYEGIDDFEVSIEGNTVQVFFQEGDFVVPATRLSDGTLRYLSLLAILCDPDPPPLVCIEEPELGLHPDILPKLADILLEASERSQIIVTTHSDVLIDALNDHPETVVICEKHDGSTTMGRPKKEALGIWLEKYSLGRLWRSGELGGNRW